MSARRGRGGAGRGSASPGTRGGPDPRGTRIGLLAGALVVLALPAGGAGQGLAERVSAVEDGTVRFTFATRPEVEICDQGIRMGEHQRVMWRSHGRDRWDTNCRTGSAEVEVRVRSGEVRDVEVLRGADRRRADARELGRVPPAEAVDFFVSVARNGRGDGAEDAVFPVILADVERAWEHLLELARDRDVRSEARKNALFWLGQEAAEAATRGLVAVAEDEEEEQEVREAAVFALSQRPHAESVPVLMELARTADQAETRRTALFWLAQTGTPEVVEFFAEILTGASER